MAPYVLIARLLYRYECSLDKDWDDVLEATTIRKLDRWLEDMVQMKEVSVPRCIAPDMSNLKSVELHVFCDASDNAYAAVAYIRVMKSDGSVHCAFVFGKSRLAPLKTRSIPRLELMAAVLAVEIYLMLNVEMRISVGRVVFWSDSKVVLCCIKSRTRRFPRFTANRVSSIQQATDPSQWCYVNTKVNPADCATRGTSKLDVWLSAPEFLHETVSEWSSAFDNSIVDESVLDEPVYNELTCCTSEAGDDKDGRPIIHGLTQKLRRRQPDI